MRVKIFKVAVMVVFAFITGLNVYEAQTEVQLSDAQMKNVEALATGEYWDIVQWTPNGWFCFYNVVEELDGDCIVCTDCNDCIVTTASSVSVSGYCYFN